MVKIGIKERCGRPRALSADRMLRRGVGQKVIVFAHHLAVLDGLEQQLGPQHNAIRIDGSTSMEHAKRLWTSFSRTQMCS